MTDNTIQAMGSGFRVPRDDPVPGTFAALSDEVAEAQREESLRVRARMHHGMIFSPELNYPRSLSMGYLSILVHDDRMIKLQKTQQKIRNAKHRQPSRRKQDCLFKRCCRSQEARRVGAGQWEDTQDAGLGGQGSSPPPGLPHSAAVSSYR